MRRYSLLMWQSDYSLKMKKPFPFLKEKLPGNEFEKPLVFDKLFEAAGDSRKGLGRGGWGPGSTLHLLMRLRASLVAQTVKRLPAVRETQVRSLGQEDPWRRKWPPTPVLLPRKSHAWRSLWATAYGRLQVYEVAKSRTRLSNFTFCLSLRTRHAHAICTFSGSHRREEQMGSCMGRQYLKV